MSSRFPAVHGAPVHLGPPEGIGVTDLSKRDSGEPTEVRANELPVAGLLGLRRNAPGSGGMADAILHHALRRLDGDHRAAAV